MTDKLPVSPVFRIGIAGGSGSGKTTFLNALSTACARFTPITLSVDDYYRDLSHLPPEKRAKINFDHPDSLDVELLRSHLDQLQQGHPVIVPKYCFSSHTRQSEGRRVSPSGLILMEGILLLAIADLRNRLDLKIFIDATSELRQRRRLQRDFRERARTHESICEQWHKSVAPMHQQFVEPSRRYADLIVSTSDDFVSVSTRLSVMLDNPSSGFAVQ